MRSSAGKSNNSLKHHSRATSPADQKQRAGISSLDRLVQMQKTVGNRMTVQYLQSQQPLQRTPASFSTWPSDEHAPDKGTWGKICALVVEYSKLQAQSPEREQILLALNPLITKWESEYLAANKDKATMDFNIWGKRSSAFNDLLRRISAEWKEMDGHGDLVPQLPMELAANPLLTKKKPDSGTDKIFGGYFSTNARIYDQIGNTIGVARKGYICEYQIDTIGPDGANAADYYKVRPNPAIMGTANYLAFQEGYVERTAVETINNSQFDPALRYEMIGQGMEVHPLFPHPPKLDDVRQGFIGDCYLLAAVCSLVHKSPALITQMMKDNGNNTVTVRLFDVQENGGTKSFTPREVTVEKSVVRRVTPKVSRDENAQGSLWVQILEKAYAAAGYHGRTAERLPLRANTFEQIASGQSGFAFEHLTGTEAQYGRVETYDQMVSSGDWLFDRGLKALLTPDQQMEIFMNPDIKDGLQKMHEENKHVYQEEVKALLEQKGVSAPLIAIMLTYLAQNKMYSGKRGTGKYTATQLGVFNTIKTALDAGRAITIDTQEKIASPSKKTIFGFGHSGGEEMAKGLVGNHAYSVLAYKEESGVKYVRLRNPWGHYGRAYSKKFFSGKIQASEADSGEFWLELSDVTKRFSRVHHVV
ncbi:hypothetical protein CIG75_09820 [Tumebacillus algifaecis]|uniref:Calpain catalytic domain-containing protein n=1 Tax=Tumebacillus algifaecis TaxID=1214604 RepID=A0A223D124_9BACL|nr:C2 family cysteine protease [Tumebacillus algifaecis]ASS75251.1 hypothetical protein CIG75_09820 [Tumebacillus algifaecis]